MKSCAGRAREGRRLSRVEGEPGLPLGCKAVMSVSVGRTLSGRMELDTYRRCIRDEKDAMNGE